LENTLFYFDPPYLLAKETYNEIWTEKDELNLLELMDEITNRRGKWVFSNFIFSKNQKNEILNEFIKKNKNIVFQKSIDKVNYNNSNYQRKNLKEDKEILLWNWKKNIKR
jgi:site-specific DNA-adenine methylase